MNTEFVSLKEIERRAYRSTFEDGVYDLQFGLFFLVIALNSILEAIGVSRLIGYALLLIPVILPWLGKRYITIPRMGEVVFEQKRKKKKQLILIVGVIVIFLTLPLFLLFDSLNFSNPLGWKLIVIFALPLFVLAVYTTDFPRLYLYAALAIFSVIAAEFLFKLLGAPLNSIYSFGVPGLVITSIGIYLLINFIRTYPRSEAEDAD